MRYSLQNDFLNSRKIIYPLISQLEKYQNNNYLSPWSVEIHPTAKCNHKCIHCSYKERNESRTQLDPRVFFDLLKSLINLHVKGIYFSGGGEPCTYPFLSEGIELLAKQDIQVALITNGTLIENTRIFDILDNLNYIAFSVPSVNPSTFEYITKTKNIDNLLSLPNKIKQRYITNSPILGARVVVTNIIANQIDEILETCYSCGFDYVLFKIVRDYEDKGLGLDNQSIDNLNTIIEQLKSQNKIDKNFTNLDTIFNYRKPYNNSGKCYTSEMGLLSVITNDGDVYQNISEIRDKEFSLGNLYLNSFEQIWNSKKHRQVIEASNKLWQSGKCQNCRAIPYNEIINQILLNVPKEIDPFI